jgi:hypothetical protein
MNLSSLLKVGHFASNSPAEQNGNGINHTNQTNFENGFKQEQKPASSSKRIHKKRKLILNFRLPANVKNQDKALEMLGGPSEVYRIAKLLRRHQNDFDSILKSVSPVKGSKKDKTPA